MSVADRLYKKAQDAKRESKTVDFKSKLDFTGAGDWCEIIKDVVAMANSGGGVILIGADNSGKATGADCSAVLDLDPAKITDQIHRYTEVHFSDFEIRELKKGQKTLAAIIVGSAPIPMVFCKPGQYPDPNRAGKQLSAFGQGTVYFRHGAKSETGTTEDIRGAIDRRLGEIRKEWIGGVRKVVEAPAGSQVNVLPREVFATTSTAATPIRVTDDPKAPAYRMVSVDESHPHRLKELAAELKRRLPPDTTFSPFDVQVIRRLHGTDANQAFFHSPRYGSPQYSPAFADWILEQHKKDPEFFVKNRDALAKKMNT